MRALIVLLLLTGTASADDGPYAQVAVGPVLAWLDRTTTYVHTDAVGEPDDVEDSSLIGAGVEVSAAGGYQIDQTFRVGGFVRFQSIWTAEPTVRLVTVGPTMTYHHDDHLFARVDLGLGLISGRHPGSYSLGSDPPFSLFNVALSAGYEIQRWQFGGALASTWSHTHEEGDFGYYDDDARLIAVTVFASAIIR